MSDPSVAPFRLADYRPPAWTVEAIDLVFDLDREATEVESTLTLRCDEPGAALRLDGEDLELQEIALDGGSLGAGQYTQDAAGLDVHAAKGLVRCVLRTRVRIHPAANTRLEGLYASGSLLLTQCEAEGFRRITFFIDRPDVQARWCTTLRADKVLWPVLLGGGDREAERELADGRHEAVWRNPHPTPCYLFALAAGPMARVSKHITGADGRAIELNVWIEGSNPERGRHALDCLERALRWDEQRFGRCYDLGVFNIVAARDFTMGAMENKGLNIFNARYILANERTATDGDFMAIESVVGHEYFHNWSGNRVTLRDWFQLSLKEGLTVFREQEFVADLHSRSLKRIEDVRLLRARQFAEDAGALAHPVRPSEYREINNFYTLTVYEKGAELIRMLHTRLGEARFRAGMDRYFADNDGRSATLEDFYAAHTAATGVDCSDMMAWYARPGTPVLEVDRHFDASNGTYTLRVRQLPPVNVPDAAPLPMPFCFALYDEAGKPVPAPETHDAEAIPGGVLLRRREHVLRWSGLKAEPLPVLNRGFAAPVRLHLPMDAVSRARVVKVDPDGFSRWDAIYGLALDVLLARAGQVVQQGLGDLDAAEEALCSALRTLVDDPRAEPALVAECLSLPDFDSLADAVAVIEPSRLVAAREHVIRHFVTAHADRLRQRFDELRDAAQGGIDDAAISARFLRHAILSGLSRVDGGAAARELWAESRTMTPRLAALRAFIYHRPPGHAEALEAFAKEFANDPLVTDKWIALIAMRPHPETVEDVQALLAGPHWLPTNPNRVRALIGSFARSNPTAFHREDGAGYALVAGQVHALDAINPQIAAKMLGAFEGMPRWAASAQAAARQALKVFVGGRFSRDVSEVLARLGI